MYLHYVYKMTSYIEIGHLKKNLANTTFEAKMSCNRAMNEEKLPIILEESRGHISNE